MGYLDHLDLPTPATRVVDLRKPASRLQERKAESKITVVDERTFKAEVWARDQHQCRRCLRTVRKSLKRVPERGEVNHLHGRRGDLRFEARSALLLCLECHEKVTGRVNEKWVIQPAATGGYFVLVTAKGERLECLDARRPVQFVRVA